MRPQRLRVSEFPRLYVANRAEIPKRPSTVCKIMQYYVIIQTISKWEGQPAGQSASQQPQGKGLGLRGCVYFYCSLHADSAEGCEKMWKWLGSIIFKLARGLKISWGRVALPFSDPRSTRHPNNFKCFLVYGSWRKNIRVVLKCSFLMLEFWQKKISTVKGSIVFFPIL